MKVRELIKKLENLKEGALLEKEIFILSPNGFLLEPKIKFKLKDRFDILNKSVENIDSIRLDWE